MLFVVAGRVCHWRHGLRHRSHGLRCSPRCSYFTVQHPIHFAPDLCNTPNPLFMVFPAMTKKLPFVRHALSGSGSGSALLGQKRPCIVTISNGQINIFAWDSTATHLNTVDQSELNRPLPNEAGLQENLFNELKSKVPTLTSKGTTLGWATRPTERVQHQRSRSPRFR